jgi:patatin-like phospholipase/acyl hydrolase
LTRLERQAGRPLGQCFDLIAGTSVGGILAIGLALEVPADRMRDVFRVNGERIFSSRPRPRWGWLDARRSLLSPKYDGAELRRAITEMIGAGTTLADAKHRLLVPAVNMTKGSVQMFKTGQTAASSSIRGAAPSTWRWRPARRRHIFRSRSSIARNTSMAA